MEFMCESDSPIKMDLSDIPHVAESEKTSFLTKSTKWRGQGEGVDCGWGVSVQLANMKKTVKARVWGYSFLCLLRPHSLEDIG